MKDLNIVNAKSIVNSKNKNLEKEPINQNNLSSNEIKNLISRGWITQDGGLSYTKNNVYGVANFTILT